jgi:CHAD domain-containing protein
VKACPSRADQGEVSEGLSGTTVVMVGIAAAAVMSMLSVLAALMRDRTALHDLRRQVRRMRNERAAQIEEVELEEDATITRLAREQYGGPASPDGPAAKAA